MFDESNGMLDAETWQIVYSFFHPEETWCGGDGSLLAGIASYLSGLEVKDGAAEYCLAEFQRNLTNTTVALFYPDGRRVPGSLNLDCDLF